MENTKSAVQFVEQLESFLDRYAATMPRTMLRYAIEHLDKKQKNHYMKLKKETR